MSITWYSLRKPITSIRVIPRPGDRAFDLIIWLEGQRSGGLIAKKEEIQDIVDMFIDWKNPVVNQYEDGPGRQTRWMAGNERFHGQVISEEYMTTIVDKQDYILERAEALWKRK